MLEFHNVSVSCGRTPILSQISATFPKGLITVLIGPNGCGKTTLLQCLNGSSQVTSGQILLENQDFLLLSPKERARKISFLPQVRSIIPAIPARMLVEHGRFPYLGFSRKKTEEDRRIVEHALSFTHTTPYADQSTDTLSGGIRQRVFFAMSLAQDCSYMVLDEPTTYLDPDGQRNILSLIRELKNQGKTMIVTLHDLNQALHLADRLVIMNDRKVIAQDVPEVCLKRHIIEDVFHVSCKQFHDEEGTYYFFQ